MFPYQISKLLSRSQDKCGWWTSSTVNWLSEVGWTVLSESCKQLLYFFKLLFSFVPLPEKHHNRKFSVALTYHFRMIPAPSKFGPSQEAIDRAAKGLVSLRRGKVSDDKAFAIWPLWVASSLRRGGRTLIRPRTAYPAVLPSPPQIVPTEHGPTVEMILESVINEGTGEIITENRNYWSEQNSRDFKKHLTRRDLPHTSVRIYSMMR